MQEEGRDPFRRIGEPGGAPRIVPFPGSALGDPVPEPGELPPVRRRLWTRRGTALDESYLLAVFFLALVARVAVVMSPADVFLGPGLVMDQLGLRVGVGLGLGPTAMLPPLYPHYLGLLYRLYGYSHVAVVLSQALLGALTAVLIAILARYSGANRAFAGIAGLLVALHPQALAQVRHLSPQILTGFLFTVGTLVFLRGRQTGSRIAAIATGLIFGVMVLGRAGLVVPGLTILLAQSRGWRSRFTRTRRLLAIALLFAVIVPWNVRNSMLHHQPVFVDSTWAMRLRAATIPGSHEIEYRVPGRFSVQPDAMEALDNRLAVADVIGFALTEPGTVLAVWGERLREMISFSGWNDAATQEAFPYQGIWYRVAQALAQGFVLSLVLTWAVLFPAPGRAERMLGIAVLGIVGMAMTGGGTGDARLYAFPFLVVLAMRGARDLLIASRVTTDAPLEHMHDPGPVRRWTWALVLLLTWLHGVAMWVHG